jgi:hypothetical protein
MKVPAKVMLLLGVLLSSCVEKPRELVELERQSESLERQKAEIDSLESRLKTLDSLEKTEEKLVTKVSGTGFSVPDFRTQLQLHRSICNDEQRYKNSEGAWEVEVLGSSTGTIMRTEDGGVGVAIHYDPVLESPDGMFILYGPGPSAWSQNGDFPSLAKGTQLLIQGRVLGNMHGDASGCVPVLEVSRVRTR